MHEAPALFIPNTSHTRPHVTCTYYLNAKALTQLQLVHDARSYATLKRLVDDLSARVANTVPIFYTVCRIQNWNFFNETYIIHSMCNIDVVANWINGLLFPLLLFDTIHNGRSRKHAQPCTHPKYQLGIIVCVICVYIHRDIRKVNTLRGAMSSTQWTHSDCVQLRTHGNWRVCDMVFISGHIRPHTALNRFRESGHTHFLCRLLRCGCSGNQRRASFLTVTNNKRCACSEMWTIIISWNILR